MKNWEKMFAALGSGSGKRAGSAAKRSAPDPQSGSAAQAHAAGSGIAQTTSADIRRHLNDLWSNILLRSGDTADMVMFCGAAPGAGCSLLSFRLAEFLAAAHSMKTLYVDTAIDMPEHSTCVPGMHGRPGLAEFVNGEAQLDQLIAATDYPNLFVLPSGARQGVRGAHKKIISGNSIETLIQFCRSRFDFTLFDGQPVVARPLAIEFAKRIKNVILVCRYGITRREVAEVSIDKLSENGVSVTGVVLNDRELTVPAAFYSLMK
jgi:Mrp family chromosome partitioning ATPase